MLENEKKKKAIIYCRVSTKEQVEQHSSLETQEKACKDFALVNDLDISKIFIEQGESAKTQDRTELQKLLKYIIDNNRKISALIIWKYDRLARILADQIDLTGHLRKHHIRTLSVTESNEETASGNLVRNMIGSVAQYENELKGERTIVGMKEALKNGYWCWPAPRGYKFVKNNLDKSILTPTLESKYIKEAFEHYSTGIYKQTEIVSDLKKKGFECNKSLMNRILKHSIYAGIIRKKRMASGRYYWQTQANNINRTF